MTYMISVLLCPVNELKLSDVRHHSRIARYLRFENETRSRKITKETLLDEMPIKGALRYQSVTEERLKYERLTLTTTTGNINTASAYYKSFLIPHNTTTYFYVRCYLLHRIPDHDTDLNNHLPSLFHKRGSSATRSADSHLESRNNSAGRHHGKPSLVPNLCGEPMDRRTQTRRGTTPGSQYQNTILSCSPWHSFAFGKRRTW
jgi:hypothetical protein